MIFDTGSVLMWISSVECPIAQCPKAKYDFATTSTETKLPYTAIITYISTINVGGNYYTDFACLKADSCTQNTFMFLAATNATGMNAI